MEIAIIALLILLTVIVIFVAFKLFTKDGDSSQTNEQLRSQEEKLERTRMEIQQLLNQQNELLNNRLDQTNKTIVDQLNNSQKSSQQNFAISQKAINETEKKTREIISSVTEKLKSIEKTNEQVVDFAKQLESLEKILKNPKQRGVLGEYFLETTLKNVLPPEGYEMQYKFKNGDIVDAIVRVKDKIVPIDSKFSLENYNRIIEESDPTQLEKLQKEFKNDLKKRIDETAKYIRPDEDTMEFAFMFIPSEGIYYDLLINKVGTIKVNTQDLITYAFKEKGVVIVSPTSFLAYLQTVLQGLRALKIEETAKEIRTNVIKLKRHLAAYEDNFSKIGKHLGTTVGAFNASQKEFRKIDKDVMNITGSESIGIMVDELERPED